MRKFIFMWVMLLPLWLQASPIVLIQQMNRQQMLQEAAKLGKMTFENGKINVYSIDNDLILSTSITEEIAIVVNADNSTIGIVDENGEEQEIEVVASLQSQGVVARVYPNPAVDNIYVEGAVRGTAIRIFSLDGQILLSETVNADKIVVPVSELPIGNYLLQVNQTLLKMIKQ